MIHRQKILPFYMTYPFPFLFEEEDTVMRDLEYLQEMYPQEARKYQKTIMCLLDRFDYDCSVIYDEFPDRLAVYRIAQSIMGVIEEEQKQNGETIPEMQKNWVMELVQVLLFYEIYKRRQGKGLGFLKF